MSKLSKDARYWDDMRAARAQEQASKRRTAYLHQRDEDDRMMCAEWGLKHEPTLPYDPTVFNPCDVIQVIANENDLDFQTASEVHEWLARYEPDTLEPLAEIADEGETIPVPDPDVVDEAVRALGYKSLTPEEISWLRQQYGLETDSGSQWFHLTQGGMSSDEASEVILRKKAEKDGKIFSKDDAATLKEKAHEVPMKADLESVIRKGTRVDKRHPQAGIESYLSQFKEPYKKGTLEFYRYMNKEYQVWVSPDGSQKKILASQPLYSNSDSDYATMPTDLMMRHLSDATEYLAKHGDFGKLMPTYGMINRDQLIAELTRRGVQIVKSCPMCGKQHVSMDDVCKECHDKSSNWLPPGIPDSDYRD